ncbi:MAG: flagellar hook-associated protein FlgL [Steroidobacteraceae bacterium]
MTISTLSFQMNAVDQMDALQQAMSKTQTQLSTGKQIQSAADNPVGMSQVVQLNTQLSASNQYVTNGNLVTANLNLETQSLTNATNTLQSIRSLIVEGNNASLSSSARQSIATQLTQLQQQMVAIGNSKDSQGNYLFSGFASSTQPFAQNGTAVSYNGANSVSQVQISPDQQISVGDTGSSVFMNLPAGNGTFTTAAGSANTGSASLGPGTVTNPSAWTPDTYTVSFSSPTQYQVTNSSGAVVASGTDTASAGGSFSLSFKGIQLSFSGVPASGDQFTVAPSGTTSVFSTIASAIGTLNSTSLSSAQLSTQLNDVLQQVDGALNNLNQVQASVGARLNAVSAASTTAQSQQTTLQTSISQISDTNYAAATTRLSTEELALQAAQASYASMMQLTLFKYI